MHTYILFYILFYVSHLKIKIDWYVHVKLYFPLPSHIYCIFSAYPSSRFLWVDLI